MAAPIPSDAAAISYYDSDSDSMKIVGGGTGGRQALPVDIGSGEINVDITPADILAITGGSTQTDIINAVAATAGGSSLAALLVVLAAIEAGTPAAGGLPAAEGVDAVGTDAYATIYTCPARVCNRLKVSLDPGFDGVLSLDGGTTDHFFIKANTLLTLEGLAIPSGAVLQGKNAVGGSAYTNMRVVAW
jgi:hypothetical protein